MCGMVRYSVQTNSGNYGEKLLFSHGNVFFELRGYEIICDSVLVVVVGDAATSAVPRELR